MPKRTYADLARLPELVGKRRRLVSSRNRRRLAEGLRRTAAAEQPPRRFDCCPVLTDRVAGVRYELLLLADTLEHCTDPDPASVALISELLTSGCSPLYNANVPVAELDATLARARAQIAPGPPPEASPAQHPRQPQPPTQAVTRTAMQSGRALPRRWREHRADRQRRVPVKW